MPLRWEILHPQKFVHIVAEGPVTLKEMEDHFDAIYIADALFKTEAEACAWLADKAPSKS